MENKDSILIVDDEKSNLLYLSEILGREHTIYLARSAEEAIERANEYLPNLILLDIIMPGMNGYDALAVLKGSDKTKDIPVIFISGLDSREDEKKGLLLGAEDYITKPFSDVIVNLRVRNQIKIQNQMHALDKRLRQQTLMTSIAQCFLRDESLDVLFTKTLKLLGQFMEVSQVLLFVLNEPDNVLICQNEWMDPNLSLGTRIGSKLKLEGPMRIIIDNLMKNEELCLHSNDPFLKAAMAPYRVNFQNYITTPIFKKGKMCAALDFSKRDDGSEWTESEISLACLVASILSGVFERESIERDLNTVLKLKEELHLAKESAEKSSRAKSEFLSRMSHEMRTPMNAIMGMTALAQNTEDPLKRKDCLAKAGSASRDLLHMIDSVLDLSDIGEGRLAIIPSEFSFHKMLKSVFGEMSCNFERKHQTFNAVIDPLLPDFIISDEKRLARVITNLLSNACKFTGDEGTIEFKASLQNAENDRLVVQVEISDNGIGIAKEQQDIIFTAFEQLDGGIKRKYGGAGLGLTVSKNIVEMMNGRIWVESEPGKGSKFSFTFTAKARAVDEAAKSCQPLQDKTVLLVEDVEINREIVMAMLENTQMNIVCAENGYEAVKLFSSDPEKYNLIFMDINMPEMDGVEATRRIRALESEMSSGFEPLEEQPQIPIIAMTANVLPAEVNSYIEAGLTDHIGKPLEYEKLLQKINQYVNR